MKKLIVAWLAALVVSIFAPPAEAIPRFSVREALPCRACHINPSGSGMRTSYGRYTYAPTRLAMQRPGGSNPLTLPSFDVSDALAIGADARFAFIDQLPPGAPEDGNKTFFQMQADLYVTAQVYDGLYLYYDRGAWGSFEAFAMYENDFGTKSSSVYLKAGRFMPPYGLRLENHLLFVRQDIGFGPTDKDQGLEAGLRLGPLLLQGALLNGAEPERQLDDNRKMGFASRMELLGKVGPFRLMAGASIYRSETGRETVVKGTVTDNRTKQTRYAGFWGASIGRRVTYLGEADVVKVVPSAANTSDAHEWSFRSYQELDVLLVRGFELNLNYEFKEPDLDLETGRAHRVAAGLELYPLPNLELKALYRHIFATGPVESQQDGFDEVIGMVHVFF